jgi:LPPG:FO 2-phospho-L-lactate transferase
MRTVVLTEGAGGSSFLWGLAQELDREALTAIVSTGDDIEFHGLRISPNLDVVTYTLADCADTESGCGLAGDTFGCLQLLAQYGQPTWLPLGDRDLATHIFRTYAIRQGQRLTEVTDRIRRALGVGVRILPMTDDPVGTYVLVGDGSPQYLHVQEYLVQRGAVDEVRGVEYRGSARARLTPEVLRALTEAETIIIAPSNPLVGIAPILAVPGIRKLLGQRRAPVVLISPVLGGRPLAGPTDKFLRWAKVEVSPLGVAQYYQAILGSVQGMLMDRADEAGAEAIEALGIRTCVGEIVMGTPDGKRQAARLALALRESL